MSDFQLYAKGGLANGEQWSSRVYVAGNVAEATAATAIHNAWGALWAAITTYMPTSTTVTETAAVTLLPSYKFWTRTTTDETLAGTSAEDSMPTNTSAVITWRTTVVQKGKNGRSFMPAAAVNAVDNAASTGKLLAAFQTALKTGATDFQSTLVAAGLTLQLLDRTNLTEVTVSEPQVANVFRVQRRRQNKLAITYA